jgi:membrane-bound serine protease (ClpP class)
MVSLSSRALRLVGCAVLLAGLVTSQATADQQRPTVRVSTLRADIDPVTANWLVGQIHAANDDHAAAIVIRLDTPGGLSTSMDDIVRAELASKVPVIVFVDPAGSRAASAGFFILQGADVAALNPVSNTGSATPIDSSGSNIQGDLRNKVINDAVAKIRALASEHGRNPDEAQKAVLPKSRTCPECPKNWSAQQAVDDRVADVTAPDVTALLNQIDGLHLAYKDVTLHVAGAEQVNAHLPLQDRLLEILIDPNLIYLLFLGGIFGIAFELTHPGIVLPGLLGGVSLVLALLGLSIVPFSWAGVALLALGAVLLAAEAHVPAHGAFAAVGILAFALGGIILFRVPGSAGEVNVPLVLTITVGLAACLLLVVQRVVAARHLPVATGFSELVGASAVVKTPLQPHGQVFLHGERWRAEPVEGFEPHVGEPVRVVSVDGLQLTVGPAAADPELSPPEQGV